MPDSLLKSLCTKQGQTKLIFVSTSHQRGLDTRSNDPKVDYSADIGKGEAQVTSRCSSPAELCWSSAYLVQCGPDEPSWTWTQIWVQAWMPDYSLNWTARSSAIQGVKGRSSPTRRWTSRSWGPYGLKSAIEQLTVLHECQTVC